MEPILSTAKINKRKEEFRDDDEDDDDGNEEEPPAFPVECYKCGGTKFEANMVAVPGILFLHCLGCDEDVVGFPIEPKAVQGYVNLQLEQLSQRSS